MVPDKFQRNLIIVFLLKNPNNALCILKHPERYSFYIELSVLKNLFASFWDTFLYIIFLSTLAQICTNFYSRIDSENIDRGGKHTHILKITFRKMSCRPLAAIISKLSVCQVNSVSKGNPV